jgi:hypothetical protein
MLQSILFPRSDLVNGQRLAANSKIGESFNIVYKIAIFKTHSKSVIYKKKRKCKPLKKLSSIQLVNQVLNHLMDLLFVACRGLLHVNT